MVEVVIVWWFLVAFTLSYTSARFSMRQTVSATVRF